MEQNTFMNQWKKGDFAGCLTSASFPPGVVSVPFEWRYMRSDTVDHMRFFAGVMAATQNQKTLAIQAEIGWAVADAQEVEGAEKKLEQHDPWLCYFL